MGKPTNAELKEKIKVLESEVSSFKDEERVRAEAELIEEQARYKRLFQYASMGILLMDTEARFVDANGKALEILGYTKDQITQMSAHDLIHPDDLNAQPLITPRDIADPDRELRLSGSICAAMADICRWKST